MDKLCLYLCKFDNLFFKKFNLTQYMDKFLLDQLIFHYHLYQYLAHRMGNRSFKNNYSIIKTYGNDFHVKQLIIKAHCKKNKITMNKYHMLPLHIYHLWYKELDILDRPKLYLSSILMLLTIFYLNRQSSITNVLVIYLLI